MATANASETFPTASVVKLLIGIDLLLDGNAPSDSAARVREMLAKSDDTIASALWVQRGETRIIDRMQDLMHLPTLSAPDSPGQWGSTRIDALDVARLWSWILTQAPASIRETILDSTGGATEIAADGFDQYFGIPDALPGREWWIKQGWGSSRQRRVVNTTGLVGHAQRYILVLLTSYPMDVPFATCTEGATAGVEELAPVIR
ncbi:hypothetical protein GIS00_01370 [Nakamurella sp. YIM 132087]|uniref:Serine hydrolase n=1 Tax=Nakamurella alba TaxID=2665158 RepID=A0A7K1FH29_9ACTN|nr:hypothetical protein [Nakamurella alba]MTD12593.1 hypothetical protein [Nakamurella alba]